MICARPPWPAPPLSPLFGVLCESVGMLARLSTYMAHVMNTIAALGPEDRVAMTQAAVQQHASVALGVAGPTAVQGADKCTKYTNPAWEAACQQLKIKYPFDKDGYLTPPYNVGDTVKLKGGEDHPNKKKQHYIVEFDVPQKLPSRHEYSQHAPILQLTRNVSSPDGSLQS